jgi:hypothetical protein
MNGVGKCTTLLFCCSLGCCTRNVVIFIVYILISLFSYCWVIFVYVFSKMSGIFKWCQ